MPIPEIENSQDERGERSQPQREQDDNQATYEPRLFSDVELVGELHPLSRSGGKEEESTAAATISKPSALFGSQSEANKASSSAHITPTNWPRAKRWAATLIVSSFAFLQPLTETMLAPVEAQISGELNIKSSREWLLCNSIILIGVGLGPLILAPLSEVYGRKPVLLGGSAIFLTWNTGCGASTNFGMMLAFRLLSGFGACVADAIAGGMLGELWRPEERGKAFAVYMTAPLLGPALGPICGAFISEGTDWRWIFWITSIASGVATIVAVLFLPETYEPVLRRRKFNLRRKASPLSTDKDQAHFLQVMQTNLQRPFRMLATQPIVQLLAIFMALLYGNMFLFLFIYPKLWIDSYGQSIRISSLNYISAAVGYVSGVGIAGHLNDRIYVILKARNNGKGKPEYRVPAMIIGTLLVPIGLLWWGWSGEAKLHWIMPNIGCALFTAGCYICSSCVSVYTIDTYAQYAASAVSTNLVTRSVAAAFFPLFAPYLFQNLGFGYGATVLAGGFTAIGLLVTITLWLYGEKIRDRSTYCSAGTVD
ncbi:MFS general substrate transporter [Aaosphaeria arxii CBS 175.79]|uniref:MFS general substrate transporter n=1 Tax=Aaosphaeria arxii CBS 175.79 TaxID=1450172 RepID=A0A6A5YBG3_9PLEO|nr:MFS general substrate transporter [Aaosphaeria arxii CBS 175.79]KAF2022377.1 MFS general substrate transporter [Aaosphaeria arxii CBS 175.79]